MYGSSETNVPKVKLFNNLPRNLKEVYQESRCCLPNLPYEGLRVPTSLVSTKSVSFVSAVSEKNETIEFKSPK